MKSFENNPTKLSDFSEELRIKSMVRIATKAVFLERMRLMVKIYFDTDDDTE